MIERELHGERLRKARKGLRIMQKEAAELIGISYSAYSDIENGRNSISAQVGSSLVKKLGINVNWVISGEGKMYIESENEEFSKDDELFMLKTRLTALEEHYIELSARISGKDKSKIRKELKNLAKKSTIKTSKDS